MEHQKISNLDTISRQNVYTFEMTQQKYTNLSITEDNKESFSSVFNIVQITTRNICASKHWMLYS